MQQKQKIVLGVLFVLVVFMYIFFSQTSNEMSPKLGDQVKGADQFEYPTSEFLETHGRFWNDENIRVAREYQIDLSKQLWSTNRNQRLKDFLDFFNSASNNAFHIKPEDLQEEGYHRYSYSVTRFPGATPTIRLRDFSKGFRSGLTTVDLKFRNGDTMAEMFDLFGAPAPQFLDTAVQKVEQDVHACDVRWSRGTRLFLDYSPAIETVDDVAKLFPDLIESAGDAVSKSGIKKQSMDVYYWQASYRSSLDNGLEYKITFTFMYPSIEDAFAAESMPKKDGEFSIRLFGENNGYSRKFDTEHLRIVDDLFEELLWSSWNVDPEMDCLLDVDRDPEEAEVWRQPII